MSDSSVPSSRSHNAASAESGKAPAAAPPQALKNRLLIQVNPRRLSYVDQHIDADHSGLVLTGHEATKKVAKLRAEGHTEVLLIDPAFYETDIATEDTPFVTPADQLPFGDPLRESVADQLACGATMALTPTGYIQAEDSEALIAAARAVSALGDPRVVFAAPIDVAWLRDDAVGQLIAALDLVPGHKALMLGGQMDPLARFGGAVGNLARVLAEVASCGLLRADLAAFGALARGAEFAAFGAGSKYRHIVPPTERAKQSEGGPNSPAVLFPELMDFFLGITLAKRFAASEAPTCWCASCQHRELDSFVSNSEAVAASAHNVAVLMEWQRTLVAVPPAARPQWWYDMCRQAVDRYVSVNVAIDQPNAFKVPQQLQRWVDLEVAALPTPPVTTPQR